MAYRAGDAARTLHMMADLLETEFMPKMGGGTIASWAREERTAAIINRIRAFADAEARREHVVTSRKFREYRERWASQRAILQVHRQIQVSAPGPDGVTVRTAIGLPEGVTYARARDRGYLAVARDRFLTRYPDTDQDTLRTQYIQYVITPPETETDSEEPNP